MREARLAPETSPLLSGGKPLSAKELAKKDPKHAKQIAANENARELEALTRELLQLTEREANEKKTLETMSVKETDLRDALKATKEKIEEQKARMASIHVAKERQLMIKREELRQAEAVIKTVTENMSEMESVYQKGVASMQTEIRNQQRIVGILRTSANYAELMKYQTFEHPAPGPDFLRFIASKRWQVFSGLVIVLNMVAMFVKFTNKDKSYSVVGEVFLLFYIIELLLKLAYYQDTFLRGSLQVTAWRYLDIFLVIIGIVETIMHFLRFGQATATGIGCLRVLRVARLLRLVGVARMFFESDLTWTQSTEFHTLMIILILINCVIMGIEAECKDVGFLLYLENIFLIIFVFEIAVRIKLDGCKFFFRLPIVLHELFWNWLDFLIVSSWALDFWGVKTVIAIQELAGQEPMQHMAIGKIAAMLRTVRVLRVLRIVQAVKHIPQLHTLVLGIAEAMQSMGWVMLLTTGILCCCSLVAVRLTQYDWEFYQSMDWEDKQLVKATFSTLQQAIFNLFQVMNQDLSGVADILQAVPASRFIIMGYMIVTNWGFFSILTAVVCDNMLLITERSEAAKQTQAQKLFKERRSAHIQDLFERMDKDGSKSLSMTEFQELLKDDLQMEELCSYTGLSKIDLEEIFDLLSTRKAGETDETVTYEQFMRLLVLESSEVTTRVLMKINKRASRVADFLTNHQL